MQGLFKRGSLASSLAAVPDDVQATGQGRCCRDFKLDAGVPQEQRPTSCLVVQGQHPFGQHRSSVSWPENKISWRSDLVCSSILADFCLQKKNVDKYRNKNICKPRGADAQLFAFLMQLISSPRALFSPLLTHQGVVWLQQNLNNAPMGRRARN